MVNTQVLACQEEKQRYSVQFSRSVVPNSSWPHGLQHARPPCPSPTCRTYSNLCPSSQWCHPTISSSVIPFSSCLQPFPASGFFPMSQFFASGGQSIRTSASASVLLMNIQDWFSLGLVWSPCSPRDSQEFSPTPQLKTSILQCSAFFLVQLSHPCMTTGKIIVLTVQTFAGKAMSLLLNTLSRLIIAFLPKSKRLLISWQQSSSAVILEPKKIKSIICFHCFPIYLPWSDETRCHDLSFLNVEL